MKVHLRKREITSKGSAKPRYTLYLDIYYSRRKRKREFLGLYLEPNDTKVTRLDKISLAENYKAKRLLELANEDLGLPSKEKMDRNFIAYFKDELEKREGNSQIAWLNTYKHLTKFQPRGISFAEVDRQWLERFKDYLLNIISPQSTVTYFSKIKCALNEAIRDGILLQSPAMFVKPIKVPETHREYLTIEEIQKIKDVTFHNDVVKRAFLFSCFTGLRFGDIYSLKWNMIKETNMNGNGTSLAVHKRQNKTGVINHIPLNETAIKLLGDRPKEDSLVFSLFKHNRSTQRILKRLLAAAKITKYITFHCARHTYAVMLLANGANLMTVKELLGHRDIKSTQIYAKVVDASKYEAVNNLPNL